MVGAACHGDTGVPPVNHAQAARATSILRGRYEITAQTKYGDGPGRVRFAFVRLSATGATQAQQREQPGQTQPGEGMNRLNQEHHRRVLATVLILYGCLHLAAAAFWWSIILGLAREGYTDVLRDLKTTTAFAMTLSTVALPLVSGLALLLGRPWAGRTVLLTCVVILIVNFMVLRQVASPRLTPARIVFGTIYGGTTLAMSVYGLWFVNRRRSEQG